jgi:3-oxoacyl-[acyl-carrier-protein] synthase III
MTALDPQAKPFESVPILYPVALAGIGRYVPPAVRTSLKLDALNGWPPGTVEAASGVRRRHVAGGESTVAMAAAAARAACADAGRSLDEIDCVVYAGAVPHQPIPTTSVLLKRALGLESSPVPAFDVNATCIGFLAALEVVSALIACGRYERVLIVCAEKPSQGLSWEDPAVSGIFGDGAAAVVAERSPAAHRGIAALAMETYARGADACVLRSGGTGLDVHDDLAAFLRGTYFEMNGTLAYKIAAEHLPPLVDAVLARAETTLAEIDAVVPHQASALGMVLMERRLGIAPGGMLNVFADYGNQVSASLPFALACARERFALGPGSRVLLLGTAAGISVGAAVWRL